MRPYLIAKNKCLNLQSCRLSDLLLDVVTRHQRLAREERSRIRLRLGWLGGVVGVATMGLDRLPVDVPEGLLVSRPGLDSVYQINVAVSIDR